MTDALDTAAQAFLTPLKYAMVQQYPSELVGSYSRDRLTFTMSQDFGYQMDLYAGRFATQILAGKAYSEDYTVATPVPATWWQHLKLALYTVLLVARLPFYGRTLVPQWVREKFPVRYEARESVIKLTGHWTYPRADFITPHAGPVTVSEDIQISGDHYESYRPSRFLNQNEIAHEFYRDPWNASTAYGLDAVGLIDWLHRHGVNMDQLVPRNTL